MKAEDLMELADRTVCQMFSDAGGVPEARVWIHTKNRVIAIPCKPRGPAAEDKMKAFICAAIYAARKSGHFEGAVLMAEAWMSIKGPGEQTSGVRPAFDPNRIEVAILMAYGQNGDVAARTRRIERRLGKRAIGPIFEPFGKTGMVYQSWMDAAFKERSNAQHAN